MRYGQCSGIRLSSRHPLKLGHLLHMKTTSQVITLIREHMTFYSKTKRFNPHHEISYCKSDSLPLSTNYDVMEYTKPLSERSK